MEYLSFDEKDPNAEFPKAYANAQAKYESSKFKEAIVDLNKAIEIQPKYANSYLLRGMCQAQLKNLNVACAEWRKAELLGSESATGMLKKYCSDFSKIDNDINERLEYPSIEEYLSDYRKSHKDKSEDFFESLNNEYNQVMEFAKHNELDKRFDSWKGVKRGEPYVPPFYSENEKREIRKTFESYLDENNSSATAIYYRNKQVNRTTKQIRYIKFEIQKQRMKYGTSLLNIDDRFEKESDVDFWTGSSEWSDVMKEYKWFCKDLVGEKNLIKYLERKNNEIEKLSKKLGKKVKKFNFTYGSVSKFEIEKKVNEYVKMLESEKETKKVLKFALVFLFIVCALYIVINLTA